MSTIDFLPIEGKLIRIYFIYLNSIELMLIKSNLDFINLNSKELR